MRAFLPLILSILFAAAPLRAGTERIAFDMDGLERYMFLTVPGGLTGPAPLIVALHGVLEDGQSMRSSVTQGRLDTFAARDGVVVVYPSAFGRVWDIGEGEGAERLIPERDDLAFLERVIEIAGTRARIDRDRVFVAGFSMGGMIGLSLACKRPGLIRAVAAVASNLPELFVDDCRAHPPDGVMLVHGTDDPIVPFGADEVISGPLTQMQLAGFDAALALFTRAKGCRGAPEERTWDARDDGTSVTRLGWWRCARGAVEGYRIDGGGHRWPSGGPHLPFTGKTSHEVDGAAMVWGFFSRFK